MSLTAAVNAVPVKSPDNIHTPHIQVELLFFSALVETPRAPPQHPPAEKRVCFSQSQAILLPGTVVVLPGDFNFKKCKLSFLSVLHRPVRVCVLIKQIIWAQA